MLARIVAVALALELCAVRAALGDAPPGGDPVGNALIPPDVVMAHQQDLGLSDQQRAAIQADMQHAQQRFIQAQWQLAAAMEKLAAILRQPRIDESKAIGQLDLELGLEREIKQTQLLLMIQVKNELTPEQQAKAFALKHAGGS